MTVYTIAYKASSPEIGYRGTYINYDDAKECLEMANSKTSKPLYQIFNSEIDENRVSNGKIFVLSKYNNSEDSFIFGGVFTSKAQIASSNGIDGIFNEPLL